MMTPVTAGLGTTALFSAPTRPLTSCAPPFQHRQHGVRRRHHDEILDPDHGGQMLFGMH